jgi:hypothetical protein
MTESSAAPHPRRPWWTGGHLLGLEAVVAALVWMPLFAMVAGVRLRSGTLPIPPEYLLLGCAVWFVYTADRLLDGLMHRGPREARHLFAVRCWPLNSVAMVGAAAVCTWLLGWHTREIVLDWGLRFSAAVLVYFVVTWASRQPWCGLTFAGGMAGLLVLSLMQNAGQMVWPQAWRGVIAGFLLTIVCLAVRHPGMPAPWTLPRKLFGGLLFATGTALVPYAHSERWPQLLSDSTVLLFGAVCALNSLSIRLGERQAPTLEDSLLAKLQPWMLLTVAAGAGMEFSAADKWSRPLFMAEGAAALLLLALHLMRHRCTPDRFRLLADAAVILPGAAVLLWKA